MVEQEKSYNTPQAILLSTFRYCSKDVQRPNSNESYWICSQPFDSSVVLIKDSRRKKNLLLLVLAFTYIHAPSRHSMDRLKLRVTQNQTLSFGVLMEEE